MTSLLRSAFPSISRPSPIRSLSTFSPLLSKKAPSFSRPGPPPLPPSDQAEFEALIKANETIGASPDIVDNPQKGIKASEELHKDVRRGPRPDFEGDVNPKTGERGGPKSDPFKAGDQDWSYAGRVTVSLSDIWDLKVRRRMLIFCLRL
ncbi:hypothetical protein L486_04782 [Kwoniella mangroviensis CBS 10435]|uniref:Succinate dehydrogenase assembly factor 4, mitochondrial n=1 Tax=Kwoniella mangroviensis CBS 10435 TaxID=1331196 RepID=A0A1B9IP25_9TREE|nr:hypothetical protein L486_04782 [Kwoniella mangroviensis CBS 10435]